MRRSPKRPTKYVINNLPDFFPVLLNRFPPFFSFLKERQEEVEQKEVEKGEEVLSNVIRRHSDGYIDTDARPYVVVSGYDAEDHRADQFGDFEEVRKPSKKSRNRTSSLTRSAEDLPFERVPVRVSYIY